MSTRTDWGFFRRDGSRLEPVAVGDTWHDWMCPNRRWQRGETYEHPYTGEQCESDPHLPKCPMRSVDPKHDECTRCAVVFIYP